MRVVIKILKENFIFLILTCICLIIGIQYVERCARNVIFMDFWRSNVYLIPNIMENKFNVMQLWQGTIGQRNPFQLFLVAFNIRFLHADCLWEVYAGMLVLICILCLSYYIWNNILLRVNLQNKYILKQVSFVIILFSIFNLNQWEILSNQFSFAFMLRIFLYILIFWLLDREYKKNCYCIKTFFLIGLLTGFVICTISQLYFLALLIVIYFTLGCFLFFSKDELKKKLKAYIFFSIPVFISVFIYFWKLPFANSGGGTSLGMFFSGRFVLSFLYMLSASLLPQPYIQGLPQFQVIVIGIILVILILFAVFLYFHTKMHKITTLPFLVSGYGIVSMPIIIYGRAGQNDILYFTSSRYTCETTLIWLGCSLIFGYALVLGSSKLSMGFSVVFALLIILPIYNNDLTEYKMSVYRGEYKEQLIQVLKEKDINKLPDDQLRPFQAAPDFVRQGTDLLKKYKLSVYSDNK